MSFWKNIHGIKIIFFKCIDGKNLVKTYSSGSNDYVTGVEQLNGLASQLVFMMYNKMKIGCDLPYTNWFIDRIFSKNNTIVDYINLNGNYRF